MLTLDKMKELGIDPTEGLTRCMNNEVFFFKMITMAVSNDYFETLGESLKKNDLDNAFEAAHALKGVIGNLALQPIYEPLAEMTELLRAKKEADYVSMYRPIKEIRDQLWALTQSGRKEKSAASSHDIAAVFLILFFLLIPTIADFFRLFFFRGRRAKLADAFSKGSARLRELARAENDQPYNENEQQLGNTESKHENPPS